MEKYFDSIENMHYLQLVADAIEGAQYWHKGRNIYGLDCIGLMAYMMQQLNLINEYEDEDYTSDWFLHSDRELILEGLERNKKYLLRGTYLEEISDTMQEGDIYVFKTKGSGRYNHIGMIVKYRLFHCTERVGVAYDDLFNWTILPNKIYRIYQGG